ncbi:Multidrug resistance protein 1 [Mizuhopecten yessoensis]|uniref:Multidrug resistance protein 1 n=1 Tax=Mizuhopecten yessoensis TaxID=6573 RepID=A0A210R392_MIZYE|nr:Multidrug resistance protein 1 [Mizuhopecten yessoensis]
MSEQQNEDKVSAYSEVDPQQPSDAILPSSTPRRLPPLSQSNTETPQTDHTPLFDDTASSTHRGRTLPAINHSSKAVAPLGADKEIVNGVVVKKSGLEGPVVEAGSAAGSDDEDKEKKEEPMNAVGFFETFRFSDCWDRLLMIIGSIGAMAHGAGMPAMIIVFGTMTDSFVDVGKYTAILEVIADFLTNVGLTQAACIANPSLLSPYITDIGTNYSTVDTSIIQKQIDTDFLEQMRTFSLYYVGIGCGVILLGYAQVTFWSLAAERQSHRIRKRFFRNVMRQDMTWFDTHDSGQLNTRLSDDINKIHSGIGDKLGTFLQFFSSFLTGITIGFVCGWKLTLVILSVCPIIMGAAFVFNKILTSVTGNQLQAYAQAGSVAEEVLSSVRTVVAFGGEKKACQKYSERLSEARNFGIKKALGNGISMGVVYFVIFCTYALAFWYGAKVSREEPDTYSIGKVLIVFFSVLIGAMSLGTGLPSLQDFTVARAAAYTIYQLIDLNPDIDSSSEQGKSPDHLEGNIEFEDIEFRYPARPEVKVLNKVDLEIKRGQTVALVGSSGCGKSTMVQLIQRFYDPEGGQVMIDGTNLKDLNVKWLRQHIGVVSQEPVLFATSIEENIRFGWDGATQDQIIAAAKMANAHDFIMELPEVHMVLKSLSYTEVKGKSLVLIARLTYRRPLIRLESQCQTLKSKARAGRTTVVVAHRLSTIKTADTIAGFKEGVIVEQGTHEQLMQKGGVYHQLVTLQTKKHDAEEDELIEEYTTPEKKPSKTLKTQKSVVDAKKLEALNVKSDTDVDKKDKDLPEPSFKRIMRLCAPEWYLVVIGCLASLMFGGVQPCFAIIFSSIITVSQACFAIIFSSIITVSQPCFAIIFSSIITVSSYMFGKSGENLTMRLRKMAFQAMLRQDMSYFDDQKNSTGALTTRLATEASEVHGAAGITIGKAIEALANIGTAIIIALIYGWKLTLVILAFIPLMAVSAGFRMKILTGVAGKNKLALEEAGKIATEAIENMRTVAGLSMEEKVFVLYINSLEQPYREAIRKCHLTGLAFSISQAMLYFAYAAAFYFGAYLIRENEMEFGDVFRVFSAVVFGGMALGQASSFAPDASKAKVAAAHIFALLDRVPSIDTESDAGSKPVNFTSKISFGNTKFCYPSRPNVQVLQGLNLEISSGETLALVGASGCGKSTTVQLIERFYDPEDGEVKLDSYNLKDLNVQWLRSQVGIVSQEPILFDSSIAENIAYGDNSRVVGMDEIISAARSANIHQFIDSLPNGYETNVGNKGTQLSGGQKQRVAIARALVRNPKILLLDEATSALDTESEKVVQEALDKAREGRTCIVIAHRLSTIRNADKICVIKHGQVAEQGRHGDLMSKQGLYYKLNTAQSRQK